MQSHPRFHQNFQNHSTPIDEMRFLEELPLIHTHLNPNSTAKGYGGGWVDRCHGFLHNTVLVAASLFFVAYLAYEARKSFSKLSNRRSFIMIGYYGSLWLVSLLNLAWCCLQVRLVFGFSCWVVKKIRTLIVIG